jgi:hypothetical protein
MTAANSKMLTAAGVRYRTVVSWMRFQEAIVKLLKDASDRMPGT